MNGSRCVAVSAALAALCLVVAVPNAFAAGPCAEEVKKFCPGVPVGEGRMAKCLNEHREDLSPECVEQMRADAKRYLQVSADCLDDVHRFCDEVEPGQGRIARCLRRHERDLAPQCRGQLQEARQDVRGRLSSACAKDIEALCKDVKPGGRRVERCLDEHQDELSEECARMRKGIQERQEKRGAGRTKK